MDSRHGAALPGDVDSKGGTYFPASLYLAPYGAANPAGFPAASFSCTTPRTMRPLPRRPFHTSSAQEVEVDVEDRLAPVFSAIRDDSKTLLRNALFAGDFIRRNEYRANQFLVRILYFVERLHVFFRYNQDMCWSRRVDVFKCKQCIVFIDFFAGDITCYDFAKDARLHFISPQ